MFLNRFEKRDTLFIVLINYLFMSDFFVQIKLGLIKNPSTYKYNGILLPRLITGRIVKNKNELGRRQMLSRVKSVVAINQVGFRKMTIVRIYSCLQEYNGELISSQDDSINSSDKICNHAAVGFKYIDSNNKKCIAIATITSVKSENELKQNDVYGTGLLVNEKNNPILVPTKPSKIHSKLLHPIETQNNQVLSHSNTLKSTSYMNSRRAIQFKNKFLQNKSDTAELAKSSKRALKKLADSNQLIDKDGNEIKSGQFVDEDHHVEYWP